MQAYAVIEKNRVLLEAMQRERSLKRYSYWTYPHES